MNSLTPLALPITFQPLPDEVLKRLGNRQLHPDRGKVFQGAEVPIFAAEDYYYE